MCKYKGCTDLSSVTIGNSITYINHYTFQGCSGLISVTIGKSVTEIGIEAFSGCSSITTIYCYAATPPRADSSYLPASSTLYVPASSIDAYKNDWFWAQFKNIVAIEE
ncbi:MAG: leucine-rich repeat protein [Bacteroidaceae bacterium]|nr:leucine-rich repeat protein [Bacteroidaceae bacterium]